MIDEAARATRRYSIYNSRGTPYWNVSEAQNVMELGKYEIAEVLTSERDAKCYADRLNLLAVLQAIREPREAMVQAAAEATTYCEVWRAMIDVLIAECEVSDDR